MALAATHTSLGERQVALGLLERAYRERDAGIITLAVDYTSDDLRPDPRFKDLLRRVGFP